MNPSYQTAVIDASVTFRCNFDGHVNWKFENNPLPYNTCQGRLLDSNIPYLTIFVTNVEFEGTYSCEYPEGMIIFYDEGWLVISGNSSIKSTIGS